MKIKTLRKKKSFKTDFYKYYFYFSLIIILITFATISQLSFWDKYKYEIQKRVYLNGISNYILWVPLDGNRLICNHRYNL